MTPPARTARQRKHDALNRLDRDTDAWVVPPPSGLHGAFAAPALTCPVLNVTEQLSSEEVEV